MPCALWQIAPEDLSSAGNQDKARELQIEDQIQDREQEEEYEEQMERGQQAESHEVRQCAVVNTCIHTSLMLLAHHVMRLACM